MDSIKVTAQGAAGALRLAGAVVSDDRRFTNTVRFYDPRGAVQPHLFATNLRLKNARPCLVLKNTGEQPLTAYPRFVPLAGERGDSVELSAVTINPRRSVEVDLGPLTSAAASRPDMDAVSVQVMNSGGDLIGALHSTDAATGTIYDVPLRDSGPLRNLSGAYPWRVDSDYSTTVTVTNVGAQPNKFTVNIFYDGGKYVLDPRELIVGETASFDLRRLRDEQVPDREGRVIPRTISGGQFRWSVHGDTAGTAKLIGRAAVVSQERRESVSYSCPTCCPNSLYDGTFSPLNFQIVVDSSGWVLPSTREMDCYSNISGPYTSIPQWSVEYSSIASVSYSYPGAWVNGLSAGDTGISAIFTGPTYTDIGQGNCYYYPGYAYALGSLSVAPVPRINDISLQIIDNAPGFSGDVAECGLFEVRVRYTVGSSPSTQHVIGIEGDPNANDFNNEVTLVEAGTPVQTGTGNSGATVSYEARIKYRAKNFISSATSDAITYKAVLVWADQRAERRCAPSTECVSARNTIPGTGACP